MNRRWLFFLLAIAAGIAAGLIYGWIINPVKYVDTSPDTLRADYKTDYVLMVAEAFQAEQDLDAAARRLALLGDAPPAQTIGEAVTFAVRAGYAPEDLEKLRQLGVAFQQRPLGDTSP